MQLTRYLRPAVERKTGERDIGASVRNLPVARPSIAFIKSIAPICKRRRRIFGVTALQAGLVSTILVRRRRPRRRLGASLEPHELLAGDLEAGGPNHREQPGDREALAHRHAEEQRGQPRQQDGRQSLAVAVSGRDQLATATARISPSKIHCAFPITLGNSIFVLPLARCQIL
jgi:hypothetical protein